MTVMFFIWESGESRILFCIRKPSVRPGVPLNGKNCECIVKRMMMTREIELYYT